MKSNVVQEKSFALPLSIIEIYRLCVGQREFVLSKQLLRSGTSIGANVEEALAGQSRADFLSKMSIASKEAREALYWLRLMNASQIVTIDLQPVIIQTEEVVCLLTSIVKSTSASLSKSIKN
jgi:four helix bundle protein